MDEINYTKIRFTVLGIFVLIFIPIIIYTKSSYYRKKEYLVFKKTEFRATVSNKFDEHPVRANKIYLKNGPELRIQRDLFDKIKLGDSVIKKKDSDSIIFFTQNEIIHNDYNEYSRKAYLNSLKK